MTSNIEWRYTFPIEKAESRDGGLFLIGYASGPEVDAQNEKMDPSVIYRFADQINQGGLRAKDDRLPYRDAHAPDGVLRDLGWLSKAWVNEKTHLGVEIELDSDNPAAVYLFKNIVEKKKKYGMSVAGRVFDFMDEFAADIGKTIRTLKDVVLTEISNTTRPAWTPSFGSVISKAIDEAIEAESSPGDNHVSEQDQELHQQVDEPAGDQPEAEKADETTETVVVETTETTVEADASKAGKKVSNATASKLIEQYRSMGATLQELGIVLEEPEAEKADSEDEAETPVDDKGSEPDPLTKALEAIEELRKSQTELTAQLAVALNRPITVVPPVMEKNEREQFEETFKGLDPSARIRAAMAVQTGGR